MDVVALPRSAHRLQSPPVLTLMSSCSTFNCPPRFIPDKQPWSFA